MKTHSLKDNFLGVNKTLKAKQNITKKNPEKAEQIISIKKKTKKQKNKNRINIDREKDKNNKKFPLKSLNKNKNKYMHSTKKCLKYFKTTHMFLQTIKKVKVPLEKTEFCKC